MRLRSAFVFGFFLFFAAGLARAEDVYVLATSDPQKDLLHTYSTQLLLAALDASKPRYGAYRLEISTASMQHVRQLRELQSGELVNVGAQITTSEWEKALIPVRIPIDRGLASFRIVLIDGRRQAAFSRIASLDDLRKLKAGVGEQWALRKVYEENGLPLVTGDNNRGLFAMLMEGRFDYLPRSIEEAVHERSSLAPDHPHLAMEKSILLYASAPRYFFVSPRTPRLAERLRAGLEILVASGEYERRFVSYYADVIAEAGLCRRIVFRLKNNDLGHDPPLGQVRLWFDPSKSPDREMACAAERAKK